VRGEGVLDGQLVEVELAPDRLELLRGRLVQADPHEVAPVVKDGEVRAPAGRYQEGEPAPTPPVGAGVIRVLLVDGDDALRETLCEALDGYDDIEVVAHTGDGRVAVGAVKALNPDVLLLGVRTAGVPTPELVAWLAEQYPAVRVLGLAAPGDPEPADVLTAAGAVAVLPADGPASLVADAILGAVVAT
jgi:CheY-like chemotaxis protein